MVGIFILICCFSSSVDKVTLVKTRISLILSLAQKDGKSESDCHHWNQPNCYFKH